QRLLALPLEPSQRLTEAEQCCAQKQSEADEMRAGLKTAKKKLNATVREAKAAAKAAAEAAAEAAGQNAARKADARAALEKSEAAVAAATATAEAATARADRADLAAAAALNESAQYSAVATAATATAAAATAAAAEVEELQTRLLKAEEQHVQTVAAATRSEEHAAAAILEAQGAAQEANSLRAELEMLQNHSKDQFAKLSSAVEDARSRGARAKMVVEKRAKREVEGLQEALRGAAAGKEKALEEMACVKETKKVLQDAFEVEKSAKESLADDASKARALLDKVEAVLIEEREKLAQEVEARKLLEALLAAVTETNEAGIGTGLPGSAGSSDKGSGSSDNDGKGKPGETPPEKPRRRKQGRGLKNTNNQCSVNSVIQFLRGNPQIRNAVEQAPVNEFWPQALAPALDRLFKEMENEKESGACEVDDIVLDAIYEGSNNFKRGDQADAGEVLMYLLDLLSTEAKRDRDHVTKSAVDGMMGKLHIHSRCSCGDETGDDVPFLLLPVPMEELPVSDAAAPGGVPAPGKG
ncbi:unnamed protein product, partial [Laminaria digitata]